MVAPMGPDVFPNDEIHVRHNGTVWLVTHLEVQSQFEMLADATMYANFLRHEYRAEDKMRVILHVRMGECFGEPSA
jgi:hypothetical protein